MEWWYELSWYSRQELEFLSNLGAAEQVARRSKKINASETIWKVSFDLVSALPGKVKFKSVEIREAFEFGERL